MPEVKKLLPSRDAVLYWSPLLILILVTLVAVMLHQRTIPSAESATALSDELATSYTMSRFFDHRPPRYATSVAAYTDVTSALAAGQPVSKEFVWKPDAAQFAKLPPSAQLLAITGIRASFLNGRQTSRLPQNWKPGWDTSGWPVLPSGQQPRLNVTGTPTSKHRPAEGFTPFSSLVH